MKKPTESGKGLVRAAGAGFMVEEKARWPQLIEYLNAAAWDDGSPRETSTLMLLIEDGWLKVCLNDRAVGRSLWQSADTLMDALDALEDHLVAGTGEWRVKKPFGSTGRKK